VLLSAAVRADRMLSANEQIINFFILHSADGSGRRSVEFPTCTKPWPLPAIESQSLKMKLKKEELFELFCAALENGYYLYTTASETAFHLKNKKYPSLGLAELALEELGKSYSCLAYYSKCGKLSDWSVFWKEWKNHTLKAHRAFFYEFFSLLRIEFRFGNSQDSIPSFRKGFAKEKEAAFYVDIDKGNRKIHKPQNDITDTECLQRVTSLIGLFSAAFYIKDWMIENNSESFRNAISDYAYKTISSDVFPNDALRILDDMRGDNDDYNAGLDKIQELFGTEHS